MQVPLATRHDLRKCRHSGPRKKEGGMFFIVIVFKRQLFLGIEVDMALTMVATIQMSLMLIVASSPHAQP